MHPPPLPTLLPLAGLRHARHDPALHGEAVVYLTPPGLRSFDPVIHRSTSTCQVGIVYMNFLGCVGGNPDCLRQREQGCTWGVPFQ